MRQACEGWQLKVTKKIRRSILVVLDFLKGAMMESF